MSSIARNGFAVGIAMVVAVCVQDVATAQELLVIPRDPSDGYIGIRYRPLDIMQSDITKRRFPVVTGVEPCSPVHIAGLEPGDILVRVNDRDAREPGRFPGGIGTEYVLEVLRDGKSHADVRGDRILLTEDLRIGEIDGDGPDVLGSVVSVGVDPGGTIHVGDAQWSQIKVFDTNGAFLRAVGGSGEGPGEFRSLEGSALDTDGRLWAMDFLARRLTVFGSDGNVVDTHPHARGSLHFSLPWIGRTDRAGHLYDVDAATHTFLVRYRTSGARLEVVDSLKIPEVEQQTYTIQRGPFIETASVPFSPQVIWDISPTGDVWVGTTFVGIDGRLWIQLERRASSEWELFTAEGLHVGTVVSPVPLKSRPRPFAYSEGIIAVTEDELGIEYVVRLVF